MKIAVLGKGSFGQAITHLLSHNNISSNSWGKSDGEQALISTITHADIIFIVVPSTGFRGVCSKIASHIKDKAICISCTKGLEAPSGIFMTDIMAIELPRARQAVMSGPNLADEILNNEIAGAVLASEDQQICDDVQHILANRMFRVDCSSHPKSVEIGGVLKNIYAILCGISSGLGYGMNTRSMIIVHGLYEMKRFAKSMECDPLSLDGLSGVGDLMATCNSDKSRNFRLGLKLAKQKSPANETTEGMYSILAIDTIARQRDIDMPLVYKLAGFLRNEYDLEEVISALIGKQCDI